MKLNPTRNKFINNYDALIVSSYVYRNYKIKHGHIRQIIDFFKKIYFTSYEVKGTLLYVVYAHYLELHNNLDKRRRTSDDLQTQIISSILMYMVNWRREVSLERNFSRHMKYL